MGTRGALGATLSRKVGTGATGTHSGPGAALPFVLTWSLYANPKKIRTIEAMWPPACINDVQKLVGCLAALSRFISRLAGWALLFFKLL
jgi:hypothetical protein